MVSASKATATGERTTGPDRGEAPRLSPADTVGRGPGGTVQSVQRALQLLSRFSPRQPQWSVSDLARETGLHKSVVTRIMATMAQQGFVVQDPDAKTYGIGPRAFAVGNAYRPHAVLSQVAQPTMRRLTEAFGHATSFGVSSGDKCVYILVNDGSLPIRVAADVGEMRDYHANAIGKVLLAGLSDAAVRSLLGNGPLTNHTAHTIASIDALLKELAEVRRMGIAYNREEAVLGAGAVAAPITDGSGECIAGLSIVYPTHVVTDEEIAMLAAAVASGAKEISALLSR